MTAPAATPAYAGLVTRTIALALDATLLAIGFAVASAVIGLILSLFASVDIADPLAAISAVALWTIVVVSYFSSCWVLTGQTVGMRIMAVRVMVAADGSRLGFVRSWVRLVGMVLAAIPLFAGYLLVLIDPRRRGLHDMLARTVVVYVEPVDAVPLPPPSDVPSPGVPPGWAAP